MNLRLFIISLLFLQISLSAQDSLSTNPGFYKFGLPNFDKKRNKLEKKLQKEIDLYQFKAGQTIADIGCFNGWFAGNISLYYDSLTIYLQDVPDYGGYANGMQAIDFILSEYERYKGSPLGNTFVKVVGNDTATNLPNAAFDKIIVLRTFHHMKYPNEMVKDLHQKLKSTGKIYIAGPVFNKVPNGKKQQSDGCWKYSLAYIIAIFEQNGFQFKEEIPFRKKRDKMLIFEQINTSN